MEKTRVPKGEPYWYIDFYLGEFSARCRVDNDDYFSYEKYKDGNYFPNGEDARYMIHKINAILKGAEMIESSKAVLAFNDFLAKLKDVGVISYEKGCEYMKEFQSKIAK